MQPKTAKLPASAVGSFTHDTIRLPGGRIGHVVPADDAGVYKVRVAQHDAMSTLLGLLGCTEGQIVAAQRVAALRSEAYAGGGCRSPDPGRPHGGAGGIEDAINERAYRGYRDALAAARPHHVYVARFIEDGIRRTDEVPRVMAGLSLLERYFGKKIS